MGNQGIVKNQDRDLDLEKNIIIVNMLTFTKHNKNPNTVRIGANNTFCDSSSRTENLKRTLKGVKIPVPKNKLDINGVHHQIRSMRNRGGIPKKCTLR